MSMLRPRHLLSHLSTLAKRAMSVHPVDPVSPAEILARLPKAFAKAKEDKVLFHFDSTTRDVPGQHPFKVTICPALGAKMAEAGAGPIHSKPKDDKPKDDKPKDDKPKDDGKPAFSPFRPPYVPGLYVGCMDGVDGEDKLSVLLNKFAVLPEHFLMCPVVEQPQTLPPTPAQLARVYSVLQAGHRANRPLFAFYNGGPGAGASQPWRHVQFIDGPVPVEDWCRDLVFERNDRAILIPTLPYIHIVHPLPPVARFPYPPTADDLTELADHLAPALMRSLDLAFDALRRSGGERSQGWNLLMTSEHLHLIPRCKPSYPLGHGHGNLELNSLGYAGLLLVRSEAEDKHLDEVTRELPNGIIDILATCAIDRKYADDAVQHEANFQGGADATDLLPKSKM